MILVLTVHLQWSRAFMVQLGVFPAPIFSLEAFSSFEKILLLKEHCRNW